VPALYQAIEGLLLDLNIAQQAQSQLSTFVPSKSHLLLEETTKLVALRSIAAECLRLGVLSEPPQKLYQSANEIWYKRWFLPKDSILVFEDHEISSRYRDDEVYPWIRYSNIVSSGAIFGSRYVY